MDQTVNKSFVKYLIQYRRVFFVLSCFCLLALVTIGMSGCAVPTWLSDASQVISTIGLTFTQVAALVASLTGNTALASVLGLVSTWISKVQTGVADMQQLIGQYQASPSTGLLGKIEAALADLQANVVQDFSNAGLPPALLSVISGIAAATNSLLAEWSSAISGAKSASNSAEVKAATERFTALADNLGASIAAYKATVSKILTTPTGDATIDAAMAKAQVA